MTNPSNRPTPHTTRFLACCSQASNEKIIRARPPPSHFQQNRDVRPANTNLFSLQLKKHRGNSSMLNSTDEQPVRCRKATPSRAKPRNDHDRRIAGDHHRRPRPRKAVGFRQKHRRWTGGRSRVRRPAPCLPHGPSQREGSCSSELYASAQTLGFQRRVSERVTFRKN